jgi:L-cysteine:1D-myo-inositol 2-amino-2-deoxy-alpha-D-glucopyranoside ligase
MRAWQRPEIPSLPGGSVAPVLYDTATQALVEASPEGATARLYVCGITPYDATHIGHAATYLAFDTVQRVWRDAGYTVHYAQNVTDVDDPLLERAAATGVHWEDLAEAQVELFRTDMEALSIIPPDRLVAVTDVIDEIAAAVSRLSDSGITYLVDTPDAVASHDGTRAQDIYFDIAAAERVTPWRLGEASGLSRADMLPLFAERGGDPDRAGKRDPLDPLLWRAARPGEPSWPTAVGAGRPGWHIECSVIALSELGAGFTVQGGGTDLIFPHHDMSAGHAAALSGHTLAEVYSHAGMVSYRGEKMSKSLGNLVLVSDLIRDGWDPRAIRLALLSHHYRSDWEWTDAEADPAHRRLAMWRAAFGDAAPVGKISAAETIDRLRTALAQDLDTPAALAIVDTAARSGVDAPHALAHALDALLGIRVVD